jgi:hypothetical protein
VSQPQKEFTEPYAGKEMAVVFWDQHDLIHVDLNMDRQSLASITVTCCLMFRGFEISQNV